MPRKAALVCVLLAAGCSGKPQGFPPGAAADAGARAGEQLALEAPRAAHVVAVARDDRVRIERTKSGLVLFTDLFQFEARDDGELVRIGDVASYAGLLPDVDDDLGGYDVARRDPLYRVFGTTARPILDGVASAYAWDGKAWTHVATPQPEPGPSVSGIDPPPRASFRVVHDLPGGRRLVLGRFDDDEAALLVEPNARSGVVLRFDGPRSRCDFADTQDGKHYVLCMPSWGSNERPVLHVFAGDHFEDVAIPDSVSLGRVVAIAADGALWTGGSAGVARVTVSGRVERFELPAPDASLARASYRVYPVFTAKSRGEGFDGVRTWEQISVSPAEETIGAQVEVEQIVPGADGRAWLVARDAHGTREVMHIGPHAPSAAFAIGSADDQRNEVRNVRGVRTWVGHCPQLFVSLGAPERVWSRVKEIAEVVVPILAKDDKTVDVPHSVIAEGRLGSRRVAGVLLWRAIPDVKEATIENAARALADKLTENPSSPPEITCTAPVLDRTQAL